MQAGCRKASQRSIFFGTIMVNQARRKDPTRGISIFFVVVILLVLVAILYKGITGRNEYEAEQRAAQASTASAPSAAAPASAASAAQ